MTTMWKKMNAAPKEYIYQDEDDVVPPLKPIMVWGRLEKSVVWEDRDKPRDHDKPRTYHAVVCLWQEDDGTWAGSEGDGWRWEPNDEDQGYLTVYDITHWTEMLLPPPPEEDE